MKERPILFSAPMVRALLDRTKTQTRRAVKLRNGQYMPPSERADVNGWRQMLRACPYGKPGDRLWVRESHSLLESSLTGRAAPVWYWADGEIPEGDYCRPRPSIHMPRWASRITLEVVSVRVERLQDISEADAIAEGVQCTLLEKIQAGQDRWARHAYRALWKQINGLGSWDANPWVWAIEFRRIES